MSQSGAEKWAKISACFLELVDLIPEKQKAALTKLQQENPELHEAVNQLLEEESALHPVLLTHSPQMWGIEADEKLVGSQIGTYKIVEHIESGGMGSVFLAERIASDFDQQVALKLIRPGNITEESIQRFKQERQILANLTHPGIARLYDGGSTESGRLYFTMEFVEGEDILTFLQTREANLQERIQYFLKIARAIAYAHARLVLHLDLKPSNILVNEEKEVKVLDFGVAEHMDESTIAFAADIESGSKPYTLAYGSPEQLQGLPVSTRSDIYSLGTLFYQILTDQLPFPYKDKDVSDYKNRVLTETIVAPSSCQPFAHSSTSPAKLRGDLDTITLACLAKKPEDRYSSVEQLIFDLEAYLENRPISLRRDENGYNLSKFLKRNRAWLSTLMIALVGLASLATFYTFRLQEERNEAIKESKKNKTLLNFVTDIFQEADPLYAQGDTLTVYDLLSQANSRIDSTLIDDPEMYIEIVNLMGTVYMGLGEYSSVDSLVKKGLPILDQDLALQKTPTFAGFLFLQADRDYSMGEYERAIQAAKKGLALSKTFPDDEFIICEFYHLLGMLANEQIAFSRADSFYKKALNCYQGMSIPNEVQMASITHSLGDISRRVQKFDNAKRYLHSALKQKSTLYQPPHSEIAYTLNHLVSLYVELGKYDSALVYAKESLSQRRIVFGDVHMETLASLGNLGKVYMAMGNLDSSLTTAIEFNQIIKKIYPEAHVYRLGTLAQLGMNYNKLGRYAESESAFREALDMLEYLERKNQLPSPALQGALMYNGLGLALKEQKRFAEAISALREAYRLKSLLANPSTLVEGIIESNLGTTLVQNGEIEEGRTFLLEAKQIFSAMPGEYKVRLSVVDSLLNEVQ